MKKQKITRTKISREDLETVASEVQGRVSLGALVCMLLVDLSQRRIVRGRSWCQAHPNAPLWLQCYSWPRLGPAAQHWFKSEALRDGGQRQRRLHRGKLVADRPIEKSQPNHVSILLGTPRQETEWVRAKFDQVAGQPAPFRS